MENAIATDAGAQLFLRHLLLFAPRPRPPGVQRELRRAAGSTAVDFDQLALIRKVLECCSEGLARRGLQEEAYLAPLYDRLEKRRNPAQEAIAVATDGGMAALVDYATIRM